MVCSVLLVGADAARAQATQPRLIPFQARLTDVANAPLNGVFGVTFAIYDAATGGTAKWVETHSNVSIVGGTLNVFLGSIVSLDDPNGDSNLSDAVSFKASGGPRFVGIKIGVGAEMVPRHQLVPAFHARVADATTDGAILTTMLADHSVTNAKLDVNAGVPVGGVVFWWGALNAIPSGFEVCDGSPASTPGATLQGLKPDLRDRFPKGATSTATDVQGSPVLLDNNTVGARVSDGTALAVQNLPYYFLPIQGRTYEPSDQTLPLHAHGISGILCADDDGDGTGPSNIAYALGDAPAAQQRACPGFGTTVAGVHGHDLTGAVAASNGGDLPHSHGIAAHDNRPSFVELFCIIRVK